MNNFLKKVTSFMLAMVLILIPLSNIYAAPTLTIRQTVEDLQKQPDAPITRGQFAMLVNSAFSLQGTAENSFSDLSENHPYAADILCAKLAGYMVGDGQGRIHPDDFVSGAEAAAMINKLLGFDTSKVSVAADLNIHDWAKPSASVLLDLDMTNKALLNKKQLTVSDSASLVTSLSTALMFPESPFSVTQASLKDDFYAYTNRKYLATATPPQGYPIASPAWLDLPLKVQQQQAEILNDILTSDTLEPQSPEWKVKELFEMYMDNETRTESVAKLKPYLDEIRAAKSIGELMTVADKYAVYFNLQPLYKVSPASDSRVDAMKWATSVTTDVLDLPSKEYYADDPSLEGIQKVYKDYQGKKLQYIGETENIEARTNAMFKILKACAEKVLPQETTNNPSVRYTKTTWKDMLALTKTTGSVKRYVDLYDVDTTMNIYCPDVECIKFIESLYASEENLQVFKDIAMLEVLSSVSSRLGDDYAELRKDFITAMTGQAIDALPLEQRAQEFVNSEMSTSLANMYAKRYGSDKVKADVTKIMESIRDKYRERIMALDWMSSETKAKAVEKLDAIKIYVSHPDEPLKVTSYDFAANEDGGNLIDLYFSAQKINNKEAKELLKKPIDFNTWEVMPITTMNAVYISLNNSIIIPAAILQSPFYDLNASWEANLGAICAVAAHEFTHAFDNAGAQYDKNGTLTDWWAKEDYVRFNELTGRVVAELSKINFVGTNLNGAQYTGETIADLGALACVLDIADDTPGADLDALMQSWSKIWLHRMSKELAAAIFAADVHAPHNVRVNFTLQHMDEFYDTYDIHEGDGMYVPKEDRIKIW